MPLLWIPICDVDAGIRIAYKGKVKTAKPSSQSQDDLPMAEEGTVAAALQWLQKSGQTHFGSTVRNLETALKRLSDLRLSGEPEDVKWFLEHVDTLAIRLSKQGGFKSNSIRAYVARARLGAQSYSDWLESPVGWSPKDKGRASTKRENGRAEASASKPKKAPVEQGPAFEPKPSGAVASLQDEINLALIALARWPRLQPYLLPGLLKAKEAGEPKES